jgi:serine/threonine protein kinase
MSFLLARCDSFSSTHFHSDRGEYGLPHIFIWLWQLACALCALGKANILHQDVKPANCLLMVNRDGVEELVVADFGVAKTAEDDPSNSGSVLPNRSAVTQDGTNGRMDPASHHHISIEMTALVDRLYGSMSARAIEAGIDNGSVQFAGFSQHVGGDLARFMAHLIVDESSDMCK